MQRSTAKTSLQTVDKAVDECQRAHSVDATHGLFFEENLDYQNALPYARNIERHGMSLSLEQAVPLITSTLHYAAPITRERSPDSW